MLTWIEAGRGKEWLKFVEVHGAVANNHLEEVKTLVLDPGSVQKVEKIHHDTKAGSLLFLSYLICFNFFLHLFFPPLSLRIPRPTY